MARPEKKKNRTIKEGKKSSGKKKNRENQKGRVEKKKERTPGRRGEVGGIFTKKNTQETGTEKILFLGKGQLRGRDVSAIKRTQNGATTNGKRLINSLWPSRLEGGERGPVEKICALTSRHYFPKGKEKKG